ncbi:unnamed protein product [Rotaria socialis]
MMIMTKKEKKLDDDKMIVCNVNKSSSLTRFDNFSNEIIYEIFDFLDIYHVYQAFFIRLEILILDNIAAKHLENILNYVLSLSKLCSLTIHAVDSVENSNYFYRKIFKLPVLKYCKVSFATNSNIESLSMSNNEYSPIEDLIIENTVNFDALDRLVSYVPELRHLEFRYFPDERKLSETA